MKKKPKLSSALVTGIYARDLLLPGESKNEFIAVKNRLWAEFLPEGHSEEELVLNLAKLFWRRRRLHVGERILIKDDPFAQRLKESAKGWNSIKQEIPGPEAEVKRAGEGALEILRGSLFAASEKIAVGDLKNIARGRKELDKIAPAIERFAVALQSLQELVTAPTPMQKALSPEYIEKLTQCEAAIDARIHKTMTTLMMVKEWKRMRRATAPHASKPPMVEHQTYRL